MNKLKINTAEKELYYKGEVILRYRIEYPEIIDSNGMLEIKVFNHKKREDALYLKEYAEGKLYEEAKQTYEYNIKNKYPIMVYELIRECNYNNK